MLGMNLHQITAVTGGTQIGKSAWVKGVSTDSRSHNTGRLFVALKGESFNGADYCADAIKNGAIAVLVDQPVDVSVPQIICKDTLEALSALASGWVRQTSAKIIAITGSNGKTTVKNMLYGILGQAHRVFATQGNLNNEIGVPLSLLAIAKDDEYAIIEMGAAQVGDIKYLCSLARPDVALITNVSDAHIGRFGSAQQVAMGKSEIYEALDASGFAVINSDQKYASHWKELLKCPHSTFGVSEHSDVRVKSEDNGLARFKVSEAESLLIKLPVLGEHNIINAAACIGVALYLQIDTQQIKQGLENFKPERGRLQQIGLIKGVRLIDDSYNANPASVKAAIDVLAASEKPTVLVFGDMAELGDYSEQLHREIGQYASDKKLDQVYAYGNMARLVCEQMQEKCEDFEDMGLLIDSLKSNWPSSGTVLVKGSRSMGLERVVQSLLKGEACL